MRLTVKSLSILTIWLLLATLISHADAAISSSHKELSTTLESLLAVQTLEHQEKADWLKEQAVVNAQLGAWHAEEARLATRIAELKKRLATLAPAESDESETAMSNFEQATESIDQVLQQVEGRMISLFHRLPTPLRETLNPYLSRLHQPSTSKIRSLESRVRNLLYFFDRIHEFDQQFTLHWETRQHPDGTEVLVRVLYLGLARAFFVDAKGDIAGFGYPDADRWTWEFGTQWAAPIQQAIDIHERRASPSAVRLPVAIK